MAPTSPEDQRKHIERCEQDAKDWRVLETSTEAELKAVETLHSRNQYGPTLKQKRDRAADKQENVREARERREASVEAAKRRFGSTIWHPRPRRSDRAAGRGA